NSKIFNYLNPRKPLYSKGFEWMKRPDGRRISSQPRYDRFDTSPYKMPEWKGELRNGMQPPFPKHSRNARASQMRFIAPCFGYALPQNDTPYRFESLTRYSRFDTSPYCPHVRANASIITQVFALCKTFFQKPKEKP
ncbi:MAG: hypothetical protein IKP55_08010, partial [Clostridia bacterium]|nr:hypothetical protein [Clostridia bacterium]